MQSLARPDVEHLEGLTAAIIVGQEPLAANTRSTFGTVTDITGMLRVLFSRIAEPHVGGPGAYSFNVPSVKIGRASCRERVLVDVDAASFEKKRGGRATMSINRDGERR